MRILVHEHVSGGGFAGRDVHTPMLREGLAMRDALIADLLATGQHDITVTVDPRFPLRARKSVDVIRMRTWGTSKLDAAMASVDAVWLIAPETNCCLERLASRAESLPVALLGSPSAVIRRACDKRALAHHLRRHGIPHPATRVIQHATDAAKRASALGYPVVVKPVRGAGCAGVSVAHNPLQLELAIAFARLIAPRGPLLLQEYVAGLPASVSLLADGRRAMPLTINYQDIRRRATHLTYRGGSTPLDHPRAICALEAAVRACESLPGLRGFIGVDLVLTNSEAVVIEVNPRLTTAYLGVRAAVAGNVAAMALDACRGNLPGSVFPTHRVEFEQSGRVTASQLPEPVQALA
jgi:predicted ATP-grasp superfamily ATP-dependent carboligase